jgi:hypothetical protein
MNRCEWIVCERGNRWATAIRTAVARESVVAGFAEIPILRELRLKSGDFSYVSRLRLREVRSLAELARHFEARPQSFAMVEVHEANLANVLPWLAAASRQYPNGRFVALLDTSLASRQVERQDVVDALFEAGAVDVSVSPRHIQHILAFAERHAADIAERGRRAVDDLTLVEWAWSQVPWQES